MLSRLIAFLLLLSVLYVWAVFLIPELTDTYGIKSINEKIRIFKRASELDRVVNSSGSLLDKTKDIAKPFVEKGENIVNQTADSLKEVNTIVSEKTEQAKQVIESAQETYNKAQETKNKLDTLTNFWTGK